MEAAEISYPYPPNTPGSSGSDGMYFHSLSEEYTAISNELMRRATDEGIDLLSLNSFSLHPALTVLRYLRANDFVIVKAIEHMKRNILWRTENQIADLLMKNPEEILNCELRELTAVFPHWQIGNDKTGRYYFVS